MLLLGYLHRANINISIPKKSNYKTFCATYPIFFKFSFRNYKKIQEQKCLKTHCFHNLFLYSSISCLSFISHFTVRKISIPPIASPKNKAFVLSCLLLKYKIRNFVKLYLKLSLILFIFFTVQV
jgi:hypothetical protein